MQNVAVTLQSKLLATGRHWKNQARERANPRHMIKTQRTYMKILVLRKLNGTGGGTG